MKKRFLAALFAGVMAVSLIGCGKAQETTTTTTDPAVDDIVNEIVDEVVNEVVDEVTDEATTEDTEVEDSDAVAVMSYADFLAADIDSQVVVETYVQDKQSWWEDKGTFYTQNEEGAYFLYNMGCSEEEYNQLVPGTKIRVTGYKAEWSGELEIADATFEILDGTYIADATDVTDVLGTEAIKDYMNQYVSFKGMTIEPKIDADGNEVAFLFNWDGSGSEGNDLYFDASINGETFSFTVESYLRGADTEVYQAVEALNIGDVIDMDGYLYWYEGINPHIINVTVK